LDKLKTIILNKKEEVVTITLNRPGVRNAINLQMIREMGSAIRKLNNDRWIRLIIFNSPGDHFCSGADLKWMQSVQDLPEDQLESESLELAGLFRIIWESRAVTMCSVKGYLPGGAIGLLAASDLVVAERSAILTFSELKLGLIPATIAPYVIRKVGFSRTSEWMMTGRSISATEAHEAGLIHRICDEGSLEASTGILAQELLSGGPHALKALKQLLRDLEGMNDPGAVDQYTSRLIAGIRVSPEGQEGMKAFLEKRKPGWDEGQ
jgi:methylglutaconyl-CoA hydratase